MSLQQGEFLSNGEVVTLISDVSHWQDIDETVKRPDFKTMREQGIRGVVVRVNENTNIDGDFEYNYKSALDNELYPIFYSFVEYRLGIMKPHYDQAMTCLDEISRVRGSVEGARIFADYEKPNQYWPELPSRNTSISYLSNWYAPADTATGLDCGLYGNRSTIFNLSPVPTKTLMRPLWLAAWAVGTILDLNFPTWLTWRPNYAPWKRENWKLWQVGFFDGLKLGMESKEVDANLWFGDVASYIKWAGYDIEEPTPPPATVDIKAELMLIRDALDAIERKHYG